MDALLKNLRSFYAHIHGFSMKWQLELKSAEGFVSALASQAEQLRYVSMVSEDDQEIELMKLKNFRFLLLAKIHANAEEELESVQKIVNQCAEMVLEIKGRLSNVEQSLTNIDWSKEEQITLKGSTTLPPMTQLLEWAEDFWRFYHIQYLHLSCALTSLQLEDESSVRALQDAVKRKLELPSSLQWALALTVPLLLADPSASPSSPASPSPAHASPSKQPPQHKSRSPHTPTHQQQQRF